MGSLAFMNAHTENSKKKPNEEAVNSMMRFKLYSFFIVGFILVLLAIYFAKAIL